MKRAALLILAPIALTLAACGSSSDDATGTPTASVSPSASASATPAVQPCDAIDTPALAKVLGYGLTKNTGTKSAPTCILTPDVTGGAIFQLNYQPWAKGGLEAAWPSMRKQIQGHASDVRIAGADAAKLVVNPSSKVTYITGFVQNDSLVQMVNAYAKPKDAATLKAGVLEILSELSASSR